MATTASGTPSPPTATELEPTLSPPVRRLRSEDRRAVLVDTASALLAEEGIEAVTMEAVASRAGVSRPLVYKHFTNRDELLADVLRREATELEAVVIAAVERAAGLEDKVRALIRAVLEAVGSHGAIFTPLLRAGVRDMAYKQQQRARNRRTVQFFARLAVTELGLSQEQASEALAVLLTGIETVRALYRSRPTVEHRAFLEDLYVDLVLGGLTRLAQRTNGASDSHGTGGPNPAHGVNGHAGSDGPQPAADRAGRANGADRTEATGASVTNGARRPAGDSSAAS